MKILNTKNCVDELPDLPLRALIYTRIEEYEEYVETFSELVRFVLLQEDDGLAELERELGFAVDPDSEDYRHADLAEAHPQHYELVYVLADDGSGVVVFINKDCTSEPLRALCESCLSPVGPP